MRTALKFRADLPNDAQALLRVYTPLGWGAGRSQALSGGPRLRVRDSSRNILSNGSSGITSLAEGDFLSAKDDHIAFKAINARLETVDTAPSYREAFRRRRCLIPADSFYQWKKIPGGKIPYAVGMKDDSPFVFAGLWEAWKDPSTDKWLHTCTFINGEPNELVAEVHTRMPVILAEEHHAQSLGEVQDGDLKELLKPFPADRMKMWPTSSRVNSPDNHEEGVLKPI